MLVSVLLVSFVSYIVTLGNGDTTCRALLHGHVLVTAAHCERVVPAGFRVVAYPGTDTLVAVDGTRSRLVLPSCAFLSSHSLVRIGTRTRAAPVRHLHDDLWLAFDTVRQGESGTPVFATNGQLVAIVVGRLKAGIPWAVLSSGVCERFRRNP